MAEFQEGTLDTLMERLCNSISSFDSEWVKRCVPATEEQIQQLQDILAKYHYTIPAAYLWYLRKMGKDDGDLLERELDFCEADIDTVLELQNEEDLEKGFLCFAYSDPFDIGFYMKLSSMEDNPSVVTDLGATDDSFLDAGLLKIGNFEGYLVFLDLVTGEVVHIYHEAVYDMSIVDGVDVSDYEEVRDYLSSCILCKDFYDFLRLVCTKDIYNEDCLEFKTTAEIGA